MKKRVRITAEEERKLLEKAKISTGAKKKETIRLIINNNLNLVKYMITRYFSYAKLDYDEAFAEGTRALIKAVEKFDTKINSNRFAVYAGCWITQHIRSYIEKTKLIKNTPNSDREMVYYDDSSYSGDDKNSYSLLENVSSGSYEASQEIIRSNDISKCINNLVNSLEERELILFTRLYHSIAPSSCLDVYKMADILEKDLFLKEIRINKKLDTPKKVNDFLSGVSYEKKIKTSTVITKYSNMFLQKSYKIGQIADIIKKSENYLRKLKQISLDRLKVLAQESKISSLQELL